MIKRFLTCFFVLTPFLLISCASNSQTSENDNQGTGESVSISIPKRENKSFFSSIPAETMALLEYGTPASIKSFASKIHKSLKENYTEQEIVALNICSAVMTYVWPSESFNTTIPDAAFYNKYTPIINSVKFGVYDTSSGDNDFFTCLLPNLLILTQDMKDSYCPQMIQSLEKCLTYNENSPLTKYLLGLVHLRMGNAQKSLDYLKSLESPEKKQKEVLIAKCKAYFSNQQYKKSAEFAEKVLSITPDYRPCLEILCQSLLNKEKWTEADSVSVELLRLDPDNVNYMLMRARALLFTGEYLKASTILNSCERMTPTHKDYLVLRGLLQKNWTKNMNAAVECMKTALELYPDDFEVLLLSAQIASSSGEKINNKSAIDLLTIILEKDKNNIDARELYVKELLSIGNYEKAYQIGKVLIESEDVDLFAICDFVDVCNSLKKFDEAWEIAQKLYDEDPLSEEIQRTYIKTLIIQDKKTEASELIEYLLPKSTSPMKSFLYYEKSFLDTGDKILDDLRTSLSYNGRNTDSLYKIYQIYYANKNWKMALFYLKQLSAIKPNDQEIKDKVAELEKY